MRRSKWLIGLLIVSSLSSIALSALPALADTPSNPYHNCQNGGCSGGYSYDFSNTGSTTTISFGTAYFSSYIGVSANGTSVPMESDFVNVGGYNAVFNSDPCLTSVCTINFAGGVTNVFEGISGGTLEFSDDISTLTSEFAFINPMDGSTVSDFTYWTIGYSASSTPGTLQVAYSPAAGYSGSTGVDTISFSPFVNTNPVSIIKSQPLFFPPLEPPIVYNATATLFDASGSVEYIATSTFSIVAPYVGTSTPVATSSLCGVIPPQFFGTTSTAPYFYVESPIPDIQYGLCTSFLFSFLPSPAQQSDIQFRAGAIGNIISKKPPVGYFSQAIAAMGSFSLASSSTS